MNRNSKENIGCSMLYNFRGNEPKQLGNDVCMKLIDRLQLIINFGMTNIKRTNLRIIGIYLNYKVVAFDKSIAEFITLTVLQYFMPPAGSYLLLRGKVYTRLNWSYFRVILFKILGDKVFDDCVFGNSFGDESKCHVGSGKVIKNCPVTRR